MRILIIFFLLAFPILGFSQTENTDDDSLFVFTRIVTSEGSSKMELFGRANEWFVKVANNKSKSFIAENETGKIEAVIKLYDVQLSKGLVSSSFNGALYCHAYFTAKDNKYRIIFSDFIYDAGGPLSATKPKRVMGFRMKDKQWQGIKEDARKNAKTLIEQFISYMEYLKKKDDF